jgi:hypothetical protein
MHDELEVFVRN